MTIQNIEDVMDRIMSLNRNLTEDSLRTLLSASGWDKDDIVEGIRLFKVRAGSAHSFANAPAAAPVFGVEVKPETDYAFNLKKEEPKIDIPPIKAALVEEGINLEKLKAEVPPVPPTVSVVAGEDKPKKSLPAKIFSIVLIFILILLATAYFFPSIFGNTIDMLFMKNNNSPQTSMVQDTAQATSSIINSSATDTMINSTTSLDTLLKEISNLRDEFNNYKQANQSSQTIVKYISQRGPTGKAGRGISSVSATSTGFVINYTDNTSTIIPYSTTTIINILNSNSVCFRDITSTSTNTVNDVCLNRDMVSKLIASSTISH